MGILSGAMRGFGEGLQKAATQYGDFLSREKLQEEAAQVQAARDQRLQEFQQQSQQAGFAHADTAAAADRTFKTELYDKEQKAALDRQQQGFKHEEDLAAGRNKLLQAQIDAHKSGFTLQPLADGRLLKVGKDGTTSYLMDPNDPTKALVGPKDVSSSSKMLVDGNNKIIEGLMKQASDPMTQPDQRAMLNNQIEGLRSENKRLLGFVDAKGGSPQPKPIVDPFAQKETSSPAKKQGIVESAAETMPGGGRVSIPGMGMMTKNAAKALVPDLQKQMREAQDANDMKKTVEIGNTIQAIWSAVKGPGI